MATRFGSLAKIDRLKGSVYSVLDLDYGFGPTTPNRKRGNRRKSLPPKTCDQWLHDSRWVDIEVLLIARVGPPQTARSSFRLRAEVFTTGAGNGCLPGAIGGAHRRKLSAYVYLLGSDTPEQVRQRPKIVRIAWRYRQQAQRTAAAGMLASETHLEKQSAEYPSPTKKMRHGSGPASKKRSAPSGGLK